MYAVSAVPNWPYLDPRRIHGLDLLRDNWQVMRDEVLALNAEGDIKASERYDDVGFNSFFRRGWKRFYLKWYDDPLPSARRACPRTVALLEQVPRLKAAMFALLPPGGRLVRHRDPYAGSLRYHLGLITPNDDRCFIEVDGERYSWRDGEHVVFDETYIHHAENTAETDRLILFCDVERPLRYRWARSANRFMARHLLTLAATQNREGEKVCALNRLFGFIYPVRNLLVDARRGAGRAADGMQHRRLDRTAASRPGNSQCAGRASRQ